MEKKTIIKTETLSKSFSNGGIMQNVLRNIDLEIYEGDFTVIMGASGAGKSTLMYALSGMDTPTLGNIFYDSTCITKMNTNELASFRRTNAGFVFQQVYLVDSMSVMDNCMCAGLLVSKNKKEVAAKAKSLLNQMDIPDSYFNKFPTQLSGGEAQRVGIARALINTPKVLFADEPTGALNSKTGADVLNALTRFNEQGQSIVMVTHDFKSALRANRILYLKDGEIAGELNMERYNPSEERKHKLQEFLSKMGW